MDDDFVPPSGYCSDGRFHAVYTPPQINKTARRLRREKLARKAAAAKGASKATAPEQPEK